MNDTVKMDKLNKNVKMVLITFPLLSSHALYHHDIKMKIIIQLKRLVSVSIDLEMEEISRFCLEKKVLKIKSGKVKQSPDGNAFNGGGLMELIKWKDSGEVFEVVLNRPEAYNSLNENMLKELKETLILAEESTSRIMLIKGSGKGFSAGGDIKMMLSSADENLAEEVIDTISDIVMMLYSMPKITVAAVHGAAAGLGMSLALGCDHVLAEKEAKLAMNFIGIGLIPDGGGHFFLERRVGETAAKELIWSGKKLTADEAQKLRLVDAVFGGDLDRHAGAHLEKLLESPLSAMIETKKIYQTLNAGRLEQTLALEKKAQLRMRRTKDHQEGIRAFLEKRKPHFNHHA